MASPASLPPELKPVAQYLQRAHELKEKDPVMAYWCTYYAAKQGIGLKVRSKEGRSFLIDMMDSLEKMKLQLGDTDALGDEAGQAYIENFALRVFEMADREDRAGGANKGTARKFLAASCFLDLMNIFENVDPDITQKVAYAKWRAAEISKALREGRQPVPPARDSPTGLEDELSAVNSDDTAPTLVGPPPTTFAKLPEVHSPRPSPGAPRNVPLPDSPPRGSTTGSDDNDLLRTPTKSANRMFPSTPDERSITPGMWSTVATPGLDDRFPAVPNDHSSPSGPPRRPTLGAQHDEPDEDAWSTASNNPLSRQNSWTPAAYPDGAESSPSSTVVPQLPPPPATFVVPPDGNTGSTSLPIPPPAKRVHFSPSVVGGSEASTSPPASVVDLPPSPPGVDVLRSFPGPSPMSPPSYPSAPSAPSAPPAPPTFRAQPSAPPAPYPGTSRVSAPPPPQPRASAPPPPPPEAPIPSLTPKAIAAVQKHCKFAISALDYEDAETARKELRTALAMLGG